MYYVSESFVVCRVVLLDVGCHLQSVNNETPSLIQDKSTDVSYALSSNQIPAPAYFLDRPYQKHVCFHFDFRCRIHLDLFCFHFVHQHVIVHANRFRPVLVTTLSELRHASHQFQNVSIDHDCVPCVLLNIFSHPVTLPL